MQVNKAILQRFVRLIKTQRLAHAYLFVGPADTGKGETALSIAKLVNCESSDTDAQQVPCGQCLSCKKIDSGNHPDVFILDTGDEQSIRIAKVRDLLHKIPLRPFEGKRKVFIIKDAEKMTLESANALLKTLEEPSASSLLILTTRALEKNLGTVKSRCHAVRFLSISNDPVFSERKNDIIDNIVFQENNDSYIKEVAADKDRTKEVLDVLLYWFRDLILLKSGAGQDRCAHADRICELEKLESRYSFRQLEDIVEGVVDASRLLGENLNIKIPLTLLREKIWVRPYRSN